MSEPRKLKDVWKMEEGPMLCYFQVEGWRGRLMVIRYYLTLGPLRDWWAER